MADQEAQRELIGKRIIFNRSKSPFIVKKYITGGAFGMIFRGMHEKNQMQVAIKMESREARQRQLYLEYGFYVEVIGRCRYTPRIFTIGMCGNYYALVMSLLGPSLNDLFKECKVGLTEKCIAALGVKLTEIFKYVHHKGLIYRDVKPQNFLVGQTNSSDALNLYIIDLGLCKKWRQDNGNHIPFTDRHCVLGTPIFMSSAMHKGYELSRKDDLEAVMYMLVFLHKTTLPWSETSVNNANKEQWQADFQRNGEMKEAIEPEELCSEMHPNFAAIYEHIRKLGFVDKPDYNKYIAKFKEILDTDDVDDALDWDGKHKKKPKNNSKGSLDSVRIKKSKEADPSKKK